MSYVDGQKIPYEGYEMSRPPSKITMSQAKKKGLCCDSMDKKELFQRIGQEERPLLLLSVINPVILPNWLLEKKNILALNCHQALLPRHKGRNGECWAIYQGDENSGITWHKMTGEVDNGEILIQKTIPVTETTTAWKLFRQQICAAYEAFLEFMPKVLAGEETYDPQPEAEESFHYSWETPEDGRLDPSWSQERISRFLRATDYGVLNVMKRPVIVLGGEEYTFKSYKILKRQEPGEEQIVFDKTSLLVVKKECKFIFEKWEAIKKHEK